MQPLNLPLSCACFKRVVCIAGGCYHPIFCSFNSFPVLDADLPWKAVMVGVSISIAVDGVSALCRRGTWLWPPCLNMLLMAY